MDTKLTAREREVWKDMYLLHEKYHDIQGTTEDWMRFASEFKSISEKYDSAELRLATAISLALYDWFGNEQKLREIEARNAPEQVMMEGIGWT